MNETQFVSSIILIGFKSFAKLGIYRAYLYTSQRMHVSYIRRYKKATTVTVRFKTKSNAFKGSTDTYDSSYAKAFKHIVKELECH